MSYFTRDLLERAIRSFIGGFLAAVAAGWTNANLDMTSLRALAVAGFAAGVSAVLALIGKGFGDPDTGSVLPVEWDDDPVTPVDEPDVP